MILGYKKRIACLFVYTIFCCLGSQTLVGQDIIYQEKCQRMEKHTMFLRSMHPMCQRVCAQLLNDYPVNCEHEFLRECSDDMQKECSLMPLVRAWEKFRSEKKEAELFLREYAVHIFLSYISFVSTQKAANRKPFFPGAFLLYMKVAALPLDKLLDLLDEYFTQVFELIEQHSFSDGKQHSFSEWLSEYWWVPAAVGGATLVAVVRWLRKRGSKPVSVKADQEVFLAGLQEIVS